MYLMINECFKCGISGEKALLFDAISNEGIVKICKKCSFEEDIPIIRKPTDFQLKESETKQTIYERLSNAAGIKNKKDDKTVELLKKQETTLRDIVDRNFDMNLKQKPEQRLDLVDNFHWIIMRIRRLKKMTQSQLAKAIAEPEAAIKKAEEGIIPEGNYQFINKLENCLGIRLLKKEFIKKTEEKPTEIRFDPITTKSLTIADLRGMKEKHEAEIFEKPKEDYVFNKEVNTGEDKPEFVKKGEDFVDEENKKEELSQEEMDKIVFGG